MAKLSKQSLLPILLLVLTAFIGAATANIKLIALPVGLGMFTMGFLQTIRKRNAGGEAHLFAGFLVGAEVYLRMSFTGLPWEFVKIAVVILLITGMLVERRHRPVPIIFLLYGLIFIPAIFATDYLDSAHMKKEIMFNLSGHVCLMIAVFYFFKRRMSRDEFAKLAKWMICGVVLMSALLFIKVPEYGSIRYGGGSNFDASGGFGPNQVTAALGLGMLVMGYFLLINQRLFSYKLVDVGLLTVFTLQGFFTLSRGGVVTAGLAIAMGVFVLYVFNAGQVKRYLKLNVLKLGGVGLVVLFAFMFANQIAGGAINKRYFNVDEQGQQIKEDYSTHRVGIIAADMETFVDNIVTGAGVGGSRVNRMKHTGISAVHVEFSRMLADHGALGLVAVLILFIYPVIIFFSSHKDAASRFVLVVFLMFGLVTMSHNAMRLAMPGFFYGLGFILLRFNMSKLSR